MATRFVFDASNAEPLASNSAQLTVRNYRPVLAFDASTNESICFSGVVPQGWTGTITAYVWYIMASATTGNVDVDVSVESISDGDSFDMDGDSFDTVNSTDNTNVPGTAGYPDIVSVTLTNNDFSAAGDYIRFKLTRDAVSDTATGDMHVLKMEIRDGA